MNVAEKLNTVWVSNFKPGVYLGVSNEDYHADPAIGSTSIKALLKSPLTYWYNSWMNPMKPEKNVTQAMKFGTAYHTYMLEPERFLYNIKPGKTTTVEGCLAQGEMDAIEAMAAQIHRNKYHLALIKNGYPEVSVFWVDAETGIPCKTRYDYWKPHWVTDLKTTTDVSDKGLRYTIPDYGYDVSGAMYMQSVDMLRHMIRTSGGHIDQRIAMHFLDEFMGSETRFVFLMQEKDAPFTSRAQAITEPIAQCGLDKFREGLRIASENFQKYGVSPWPSGYEKIEDMQIEALSPSINYY